MAEEKKKGFLSKLFGAKSSCCSVRIEEVIEEKKEEAAQKNIDPQSPPCCGKSSN